MIDRVRRERHPHDTLLPMTASAPQSPPPTTPAPWERWLLAAVWVGGGLLGWAYLGRGWIAHDVGTLGQAAERVLSGELPHRDFVDVYTGGQAMLHALAFRVLGVEAMALRWTFFGAFLLWLPAVWYVARRFAGPWLAATATLLSAAATLPVYPEGMPSWYNLFLATAGTACVIRYTRDRRPRWLVLAGAAGGVSMLFKIVGLYYVGGVLLFLIWLETTDDAGTRGHANSTNMDAAYRVFAAMVCAVLAFSALYVVAAGGGRAALLHFLIPPFAAVALVAVSLLDPTGWSSADRFASLVRTVGPLLAGVLAPVAVFCVPYLVSGSMGALYNGVFVLPRARLEFPAENTLPVLGFLPAIALVAWMAARTRAVVLLGGAVVLGALVMSHLDVVYRVVWWTLISAGPVVAAAGAWRAHADQRTGAVLLLAVFGYANLVQLPYSAPIYFLYAAPLLLLLALALVGDAEGPHARRLLGLVAALCVFFVVRVDAGFIHHLGFRYRAHEATERLELPRARGIRVSANDKAEMEQLVATLDRVEPGGAILALPDAPEVYFLSARANPTGTLFDVFEEAETRAERVLSFVDSASLRVVVLNRSPVFAPPVEGPLLDSLRARLSFRAEVGRFVILWAGPDGSAPSP
jgi:hypothetical protein